MAKLEKMKVSPCEMFRKETDKYSQFDETVNLSRTFHSLYFSFTPKRVLI